MMIAPTTETALSCKAIVAVTMILLTDNEASERAGVI